MTKLAPTQDEKSMGRFQELQRIRRIRSRRNLLWRRAATRKARNLRNIKRFRTLSLLPKHQPNGEAVMGTPPPPPPHRQVDTPMVNPALTIHQDVRTQQMDPLMTMTLETPELKNMPIVTTTGDGPMGKRIQGFLYKYDAHQVSIVCVCHGRVLSPQEFVIHAGGNQVVNPLKCITVSLPSPPFN